MRCACHPASPHRSPLHCIVPPYMLEALSNSDSAAARKVAIEAIAGSAEARAVRRTLRALPDLAVMSMAPNRKKTRYVYDATGLSQSQLPGRLVRSEGQKAGTDPAVNEAYNHSGTTFDFYLKRFARNSLDGDGMALISSVHLGKKFNNAFWNGRQMAYGDGDGQIFIRFTKSLDVVGHELTHGVVSHECNLVYQGESGALNEHFADVFGSLIRQWKTKKSADKADWLIGREIMGPGVTAKALRDFGPGLAYENDPLLGTDPQPKHMKNKYKGTSDSGGVHINSGIPNHAFYLFARALGGNAWESAGAVWYETMRKLTSDSQFDDMASTTEMVVVKNHGIGSTQHKALVNAWKAVGL